MIEIGNRIRISGRLTPAKRLGGGPGDLRVHRRQRGVTLVELMIAITLVAVISGGMLFATRTSLITHEKLNQRMRTNRASVNTAQILNRQLGALIPAMGECPAEPGLPGPQVPMFIGTPENLRAISAFSIAEGARGAPQILEYQVGPSPNGGLRLFVNEHPYTGPSSVAGICLRGQFLPVEFTPASFVLADGLSFCRFSYHQLSGASPMEDTGWVSLWNIPLFPPIVRVEMGMLEGNVAQLPFFSVTVPLRTNRGFMGQYAP